MVEYLLDKLAETGDFRIELWEIDSREMKPPFQGGIHQYVRLVRKFHGADVEITRLQPIQLRSLKAAVYAAVGQLEDIDRQ